MSFTILSGNLGRDKSLCAAIIIAKADTELVEANTVLVEVDSSTAGINTSYFKKAPNICTTSPKSISKAVISSASLVLPTKAASRVNEFGSTAM